ncbi:MAG: hypothetical protein WCP93_02170 [Candidatus Berkelbacteria bacterium]
MSGKDETLESNSVDSPETFVAPTNIVNSSEEDANNVEKEKTKGELYIEKFYHPHLELPRIMPDQLSQALKIDSDNDIMRRESCKEIYALIRSGIGNLISHDMDWDNLAEYITNELNNQPALLKGGPNTSAEANYYHAFANIALLLNTQKWRDADNFFVTTIERVKGYNTAIGKYPNEAEMFDQTVEKIKQYIDETSDYSETCTSVIKFLEDNQLSDIRSIVGMIGEDRLGQINKIDTEKKSSTDEILSIAKEAELETGVLWQLVIAMSEKSNLLKKIDSGQIATIFSHIPNKIKSYIKPETDILNAIKGLKKERLEFVERLTS